VVDSGEALTSGEPVDSVNLARQFFAAHLALLRGAHAIASDMLGAHQLFAYAYSSVTGGANCSGPGPGQALVVVPAHAQSLSCAP
jgi:hypothetical protein